MQGIVLMSVATSEIVTGMKAVIGAELVGVLVYHEQLEDEGFD